MNGLLGVRDKNIGLLESSFKGTNISVRGNEITLDGDKSETVAGILEELISLVESGSELDKSNITRVIDIYSDSQYKQPNKILSELSNNEVLRLPKGLVVCPKSVGQQRYVEAIKRNVITFGLGPAGTGKSWLAVAMAVKALKEKEVERIVMTRPVVEAGERLGFLPGDVLAKVDPYLRPLYDALSEFQTPEVVSRLVNEGVIEVAPLAYMRGRTLNNSFMILDEAQNTTPEQMKMFLTRMGSNSKAVVTGDTSQVDIPNNKSGLTDLDIILNGVEGLEFVRLSSKDVVRHPIVTQIVDAYDNCR